MMRYYFQSFFTLLFRSSFFRIPRILFQKPIIYNVRSNNNTLSLWVATVMDIWTLKEVVIDDCYRINSLGLNTKSIVIDVGASIGDFSILVSQTGAHVFAYEPDQSRIKLMKKNLNRYQNNRVVLHTKKATQLDQILNENKIQRCNLMKIDCEGGEYDILLASTRAARKKIKHMAIEIHLFNPEMKGKFQQLLALLKADKFTIKQIPNPVHDYIEYLFVDNTQFSNNSTAAVE